MKYEFILLSLLALGQCEVFDLACKDIRVFVDIHNVRRIWAKYGKIPNQPPAAAIQTMVWDSELAQKAADWASKHIYEENPDTSVPSNRFTTGENLYYYSTADPNYDFHINLALDSWFNEYRNYNYGPLKPGDLDVKNGVAIGHYTQMVWSKTGYIGCAISRKFENGLVDFFVVCYYGPGGNIYGEAPYPTGFPQGSMVCESHDCSVPYGSCC